MRQTMAIPWRSRSPWFTLLGRVTAKAAGTRPSSGSTSHSSHRQRPRLKPTRWRRLSGADARPRNLRGPHRACVSSYGDFNYDFGFAFAEKEMTGKGFRKLIEDHP